MLQLFDRAGELTQRALQTGDPRRQLAILVLCRAAGLVLLRLATIEHVVEQPAAVLRQRATRDDERGKRRQHGVAE